MSLPQMYPSLLVSLKYLIEYFPEPFVLMHFYFWVSTERLEKPGPSSLFLLVLQTAALLKEETLPMKL